MLQALVTFCILCIQLCSQHPNYIDDALQGYPNDIAVVMFSAIGSNSAIGYVAMATAVDGNFADESCTLTGWGLTSSGYISQNDIESLEVC
jgi:hypothetical protein